jgi:hypothetical protein
MAKISFREWARIEIEIASDALPEPGSDEWKEVSDEAQRIGKAVVKAITDADEAGQIGVGRVVGGWRMRVYSVQRFKQEEMKGE